MKRRSEPHDREALRERIIGLGERSVHKSYYPELQARMDDLERFRALLDQSHDAIFLIDAVSGIVVDASRSAWEQSGFTKSAVFGAYFLDLIAPGDRSHIYSLVDSSESGKKEAAGPVITSLLRSTGNPIPVEITLKLVRFGGKLYAVAVARDITERQKAERELRIKESAIESSTDGILILDLEGRVIYANRAAEEIFRCASPGALTGRDLQGLVKNSDGARSIMGTLAAGPSLHAEFQGQTVDGLGFDLQISGSQVKDEKDRLLCLMLICRDISDQKAVEEMKRRAYEQLERNIEQFAVLGDHIRNPLQGIVGLAGMMDDPAAGAILRLSYQIDEIITRLDRGWVDSENVRQFLRRRENFGR
jgi:PAS domain S-box-containing protein